MRQSPLGTFVLCSAIGVAAALGCGPTTGGDTLSGRAESDAPPQPVAPAPAPKTSAIDAGAPADAGPADPAIPQWSDDEAIAWLGKECWACHGIDAAGGPRINHSAWPLEAKGITRAFLETSEYSPIAYQTLLHRAIDAVASPSPMPPGTPKPEERIETKAVLDWFNRTLPFVVIDANARYGNDSSKQQQLVVNFKCAKTTTLRTFYSRVALAALDRPATTTELDEFSAKDLSEPVTLAQREAIANKLGSTWKDEFLASGLKKLANVIGGAPGIKPGGPITSAIATDLKEELYQLFLAKYGTYSYDTFFTTNTVMASPNTAPLYGCNVASGWMPCELASPRGGFFTTYGFLRSKPQSFLIESNNYGRTSALFFTLFGEQLLAATDGPSGEPTPPLPTCLESQDTRTYLAAPRGAAAVPMFGKLCQTCHVSRHMAAGAVLFRPFATTGQLYSAATFGAAGSPDKGIFDTAVGPEWQYTNGAGDKFQVSAPYLTGLLSLQPKACVATGDAKAPFVDVKTVAELTTQLMKNRSSFARGFMRHAHRAFSNLSSITFEMSFRGIAALEAGQNKLPDLVRTYFLSDSLACEVSP